jgi:large subunit ribosomal protein L21
MKAVVEIGGKQYLVEPGSIFLADTVDSAKGNEYTCERVLCLLDGDDIILGKPYLDDGKVTFSVLDQTKRKKTTSQYFRSKKGVLKVRGHRQPASQLQVEKIEGGGKEAAREVEAAPKPKKKKADAKPGTEKSAKKTSEKKESKKAPAKKAAAKKTAVKKPATKKPEAKKPAATKKTADKPKTKAKKKTDK